ncbi:MAG: filamentous hemagglutinin N-terminal domain-containing protein [Alphaproteobacteria bacterium]|nr:filamentous hemagglutinin N-terminal domain-containing protein [Alphaproteobacteria bacterium]
MPIRTPKKHRLVLPCTLASVLLMLNGTAAMAAVDANTLPSGASVASGAVAIAQQGAKMEITQSSQNAIINWQSFDVGTNAQVNFTQPNAESIALNRVLSSVPSTIDGRITANGQVWLINPAGIVFGAGAVVNAAGVVASTMDITDQDFLAGAYTFKRNNSTGVIVNGGTITAADKGYIALLAPELRNEGILKARLGTIVLAAGETVVMAISQDADRMLTIKVDPAQVKTLIENKAIVLAPGGTVLLSAKAADQLLGATIKNTGLIEAAGVTEKGGTIQLVGADEIDNEGTLDARGTSGGSITVAAASTGKTTIAGTVKVSGTTGKGGKVVATGKSVTVAENTKIDATGATGGGEIDVGGSWEGKDSTIQESIFTRVAASAVLDASALDDGDGGTVVVRSDISNENGVTLAYGTFLAMGGANGGNGGRIETSGHYFETTGATGSASAPNGVAGMWLFDPYNVTINAVSDTNGSFSSGTWTPTGTSTLLASSIESLLNAGTSVTVTTGSGGSDLGDIIINSAITKSAGADTSLTLRAVDNVTLNSDITSSSGALNLNLFADSDHNGSGIVLLYNDLDTNGGSLVIGDGTRITLNGVANTLVGGDLYVGGSSAQTIMTNGGAVNVNGQVLIANPNGLSIDTNGGNVTFAGLVDSGNSYALVSSNAISWASALSAAASCTVGGGTPTCGADPGDTYLATVTSRLENAVVTMTTYVSNNFQAAWLAGKRVVGIGTNSSWRWAAGPEGLQDSGNGLAFFTQNGTDFVNGISGTAINGAYTNWNASEPNNSGGTGLADPAETVLQTLGSSGRWNDLSGDGTASVNYYVKETNLADSPLSIDAGSGVVTFAGSVGVNKALSSLSVTAGTTAINGGAITTDAAQTYNSPLTLGRAITTLTVKSGNFTTNASQSISNATGSAATLNVVASNNIALGAGTDIGSSAGALSVSLLSQGGLIDFGNNVTIDNNGGTTTIEADDITFGAGASLEGAGTGSLVVKPHSAARTLGIGTGAVGAQNISDSFLTDLIAPSSFSKVTFGGATTGTINIAGSHSLSNSTTFETAGDVIFASDADLDLASGTLGIKLDGAGSATEDNATVLTAGSVVLQGGSGTFTLDNGTNTFGTVAANASTLTLVNQGGLAVGTVDGMNGVTTATDVTLRVVGASADVMLNKPVTTTNGTILIRAGRTFINSNASNTGLVAGGGNPYYVYASTPVGGTRGMTTASKHYNQAYTGGTPVYAAAGNWFFYEIAPTLSVSPATTSIVYGSADPTVGLAYTGFIDGDIAGTSGITGAATISIAAANTSHAGYRSAGTYTTTLSAIGSLASSLGYAIALASDPTSTLSVTPKQLTLGSFTVANKIYDGTALATILTGNTLTGILAGDESYLTLLGGTAAFDTKNVGTGKTVSATAVTLTGEEATNYEVSTAGLTTTANITPATLNYTADRVSVYTGASMPTLSGMLVGLVGGDTLGSATSGTSSWTTTLADTTRSGVYGITGSGLSATNYIFAQAAGNASALIILEQPKEPTVVQPTVITQNAPTIPTGPTGGGTTSGVTIPETSINSGGVVDSAPPQPQQQPHAGQQQSTQQSSGMALQTTPTEQSSNVVLTVAPTQRGVSGGVPVSSIVATVTGDATGFRFALPTPVVEHVVGATSGFATQAQLLNGQALPSWLSYDPSTQAFSSANVPTGALPLKVRVLFTDPSGKAAPKMLEVTITK